MSTAPDRNAGHRTCPQCRKTDQPSVTLSERMTMVQACPFCSHEYPESEVFRDETAPTLVVVVPHNTTKSAPPAPTARKLDLVEVAGALAVKRADIGYIAHVCRERLAELDIELASYQSKKAEARTLRKMIASADRACSTASTIQLTLVTNK